MLKLLVLACVFCWVHSIPCPLPEPPEFLLGYPVCKSNYAVLFECEFRPNIIVKYCSKGSQPPPPITSTTTQPTTTTQQTTTTPTSTTEVTSTTTATTTITTPHPTTTPEVTTTVEPSTTPKQKKCGQYPVGGKMWNADISTECQPWLASLEMNPILLCNAVLVNENTLLTDTSCAKKELLLQGLVSVIGNNTIEKITLENIIFPLFGKGITLIKLKEKVNTSLDCQSPICLPESKDDYDKGNCKVGAYGLGGLTHVEKVLYLQDISLMEESICLASKPTPMPGSYKDTPGTLCSYPFVQGSSPVEKGGMLICRSKSSPSQWMLAGLTYDVSNGNKKANEPVYYWDIAKLRPQLEPLLDI